MSLNLLNTKYSRILIVYGRVDNDRCVIRQVLSYPIRSTDIESYCGTFFRTTAKYDRIFIQPGVDDFDRLTCTMTDTPQDVEGEVGYRFIFNTKRWEEFDIDDWMEEIEGR